MPSPDVPSLSSSSSTSLLNTSKHSLAVRRVSNDEECTGDSSAHARVSCDEELSCLALGRVSVSEYAMVAKSGQSAGEDLVLEHHECEDGEEYQDCVDVSDDEDESDDEDPPELEPSSDEEELDVDRVEDEDDSDDESELDDFDFEPEAS